jgi:hypothetical protein
VVEVNGTPVRADGSLHHITLSLNPEVEVIADIAAKAAAIGYVPKTSGYTPRHIPTTFFWRTAMRRYRQKGRSKLK